MKKITAIKNQDTGEIVRVIYKDERIEINHGLSRYEIYDATGELIEMFTTRFFKLTKCLLIEKDELKERIVEEETEFDEGYNRAINELLSHKRKVNEREKSN